MRIAIVTFEGFNEIDSFVALNILNRVKREGWKAEIIAPSNRVTSMNGVTVHTQQPLSFVNQADAVLFGSGKLTRTVIQDEKLMSSFQLEPSRQLIGSQCSGALIMKRLGLVENTPICTDLGTRPWLVEFGAQVIDQSFMAKGNIATAGGCLAAQYLAAWIIHRSLGREAVVEALSYVAPVGEEQSLVERVFTIIETGVENVDTSSYVNLTSRITSALR
ncbi:MAG: DJ-1/PfpI family protein [Pseudanabaenales cyanobacterium]|nr:DJ-1/PfpI family protein [Pseudanabaenales cyanobacterium]